jgi:hypothetical protein
MDAVRVCCLLIVHALLVLTLQGVIYTVAKAVRVGPIQKKSVDVCAAKAIRKPEATKSGRWQPLWNAPRKAGSRCHMTVQHTIKHGLIELQ